MGRPSSEFSTSCLCRAGSGRQQAKQGVPDATLNSGVNISSALCFSTGRKIFIRTRICLEGRGRVLSPSRFCRVAGRRRRRQQQWCASNRPPSLRPVCTRSGLHATLGRAQGRRTHSSSRAATRWSWFPPVARQPALLSPPPCVGADVKEFFQKEHK